MEMGMEVGTRMGMEINVFFPFEGGRALPEDTSCEGCGVGTQEKCKAGCRYLGRLGGDQKNQFFFGL